MAMGRALLGCSGRLRARDLDAQRRAGARVAHGRPRIGVEHAVDDFGDVMGRRVEHVLVGRPRPRAGIAPRCCRAHRASLPPATIVPAGSAAANGAARGPGARCQLRRGGRVRRGRMPPWSGAGCPSASRLSARFGKRAITTSTRPPTPAGSRTTPASTTSSPVPAASARACSWTPSRSCTRAAKRCSGGWPSMTAGTWSRPRPVVRLDFSGGNFNRAALRREVPRSGPRRPSARRRDQQRVPQRPAAGDRTRVNRSLEVRSLDALAMVRRRRRRAA